MGWGSIIGAAGGLIGGLLASESSRESASAAQYAAQLQWDIANRIQARRDELFALWRQEYKPLELNLQAELAALPGYVPQYATAVARGVSEVRKQFSIARRKALECMPVRCVGAQFAAVRDLALNEALAAGWAGGLMSRAEDTMKRSLDHQQRQERLTLAQFAHQAYFSTDGTQLAVQIADRQQRTAAQAASNNAEAAGRMITWGLNSLFGQGGVLADKPNPKPQANQSTAISITLPAPATNQDAGNSFSAKDTELAASDAFFTIDSDMG